MPFERGQRHELADGARGLEGIGDRALFVDGEQDVGFDADNQCALGGRALERRALLSPCAERSKRSMARDRYR